MGRSFGSAGRACWGRNRVAERRLSGSPSTLSMFARAAAAVVPGATRLPFVAGGGGEVPDLTLVLDDVGVDPERLAAYDRVCGFDVGDKLPATYLHVLAFPLHLSLMTDGGFPVTPIGLVHIANRITQYRPVRAGERLSLRVWATPLEPHARGRQFALCSEAGWGASWCGRSAAPTSPAEPATLPPRPSGTLRRPSSSRPSPGGCRQIWGAGTARSRAT